MGESEVEAAARTEEGKEERELLTEEEEEEGKADEEAQEVVFPTRVLRAFLVLAGIDVRPGLPAAFSRSSFRLRTPDSQLCRLSLILE